MKNKLSVKQNGSRDCASACVLSLMRYYNGNASKEEISYLIKTDERGTNAYNLIEGTKKLGFDGYGLRINFNDLINSKLLYPVIAHIKKDNMYHYIVLYEVKNNFIRIMDPSYGIKNISYKEFEDIYQGVIIKLYPVKKILNIKNDNKLINLILNYILSQKKMLSKALLLSITIILLNIINNLYLKMLIDYIYPNFKYKILFVMFLSFLLIIFLKNIFERIRSIFLIKFKNKLGINITSYSLDYIMHLPYFYFKNKPTGDVISRIDDLDNLKELISNIMLNIFVNILLISITMIILLVLNKTLFFINLIMIIIYFIISFVYSYINKKDIYDIQSVNGIYKKELMELFCGYETYKNLNIIDTILGKMKYRLHSLNNKIEFLEFSYTNQIFLKKLISDLSFLFINSVGIILVVNKTITLGDFVIFNSLIYFFTEPIKEILNFIPNITLAKGSYERINDLLMIEKEEDISLDNKKISGDIIINNLSYSYNNYDYVFKNKNFIFKENNKYLIYGKSGNGKSTLIKILLGNLEDYKGNIFINNINIKDINKNIIRNSITYVSQKEILLNETIENNIKLLRNISEKDYMDVIKICKIDKIFDNHPLREKFLIEENGFNLSGGERQKIILARSLLKKSNYIILDESLSEVGIDEEIEIINGILKKYKKSMLIYISHKEETKKIFKYKYYFS